MEPMETAEEGDKSEEEELTQKWASEFLKMQPDVQDSIITTIVDALPSDRKSELKEVVNNALKKDIVGDMPIEIGVKIFSYLSHQDRFTAGKVSRGWQFVSDQKELWEHPLSRIDKHDKLFSPSFPPLLQDYPTLIYEKRNIAPDPYYGNLLIRCARKAHFLRSLRIYTNWHTNAIQSAVKEIHGENEIICMKMGEDFAVTAGDDSSLILTKFSTELTAIPLIGHTDKVTVIEISPNGKFILTGSLDRTIKVWNSENGECVTTFYFHREPILAIAIDSTNTVVSSDGVFVFMWDIEIPMPKRILWDYTKCYQNVSKIFFNGTDLLTVSGNMLLVWNPLTATKIGWIEFHSRITAIDMKKETDSVVVGCENGYISVWTLSAISKEEPNEQFIIPAGSIIKAEIYGASHIIAMSEDGNIRVGRMEKEGTRWKCKSWFPFDGVPSFLDFQTTEFGLVVTNSVDGTVRLWSVCAGLKRNLFSMTTAPLGSRVYSIQCNKTKLVIACGSNSHIEPTKLVVSNFGCNIP